MRILFKIYSKIIANNVIVYELLLKRSIKPKNQFEVGRKKLLLNCIFLLSYTVVKYLISITQLTSIIMQYIFFSLKFLFGVKNIFIWLMVIHVYYQSFHHLEWLFIHFFNFQWVQFHKIIPVLLISFLKKLIKQNICKDVILLKIDD